MTKELHSIRSICVYCGSSPGTDPAMVAAASRLGTLLAEHHLRLVYGGGDRGLMGAVAKAVLAGRGAVLGVIPEFLLQKEQSGGSDELAGATISVVDDMHTRKHQMFEAADAFIALPGGIGTLEELVEMMTWAQLARHEKPIGLLNTNQFWSPFVSLVEHMSTLGFIHNPERTVLKIAAEPEELLRQILGR